MIDLIGWFQVIVGGKNRELQLSFYLFTGQSSAYSPMDMYYTIDNANAQFYNYPSIENHGKKWFFNFYKPAGSS